MLLTQNILHFSYIYHRGFEVGVSVQYTCLPGMVIVSPLFTCSVLNWLKGITSGVLIPLHMLKYQVLWLTRSLVNWPTTTSTLPNVAMLELQNKWVAIVIYMVARCLGYEDVVGLCYIPGKELTAWLLLVGW